MNDVEFSQAFLVPSGTASLRFVVRDKASMRIGSLEIALARIAEETQAGPDVGN